MDTLTEEQIAEVLADEAEELAALTEQAEHDPLL